MKKKKESTTGLKSFLDQSKKYVNALDATLIVHEVQIEALLDNQRLILENLEILKEQFDSAFSSIENIHKRLDCFSEAKNILIKDVAQIHEDIELHGKWIDQIGEQLE